MRSSLRAITAGVVAAFSLAASATPVPTVTGPVASTAVPGDPSHNYVFFATDHPMATNGYVEEEYFLEGTANRYLTPTGATGSVIDGGHPYKTRVIVRRPASDKNFNGTVFVEWTNVTNGFDAENMWFFGWEHIVRAGYAWVGVSAQRVGVDRLKSWNATRYGTLDVSQGGTITPTDAVSYDIFAQAGQAVRTPGAVNILGNLHPKYVIATGESQSSQRLSTYINSVMPLGHPYDGALLISTFGQGIRADSGVPVFKVLFEWDVQTGEAAVRQADTALFRAWEVAGTAHVDHHLRLSREPNELRDLGTSSEATAAPNCTVPNIGSRSPSHYVVAAAMDAMVKWVSPQHQQPTASPKMTIATFGPGNAATIQRDAFNIAQGGVRLASMAVPTAANVGQNNGLNSAGSACPRWGYHLPFDLATLNSLYPNKGQYLDQVVRVTKQNVKDGFLLQADADATIDAAQASRIGQ
jgi:hypothetical protein